MSINGAESLEEITADYNDWLKSKTQLMLYYAAAYDYIPIVDLNTTYPSFSYLQSYSNVNKNVKFEHFDFLNIKNAAKT